MEQQMEKRGVNTVDVLRRQPPEIRVKRSVYSDLTGIQGGKTAGVGAIALREGKKEELGNRVGIVGG